ncbi:hypothetical protein LPJ66_003753 [Kickxella alabastrina]|uniref:Uncharacterized protein n=1 Tax=Kickxella alabastrina TaxID=61397 RepID=A0ACC1IMN7_9FUNG|nr:hypothetical protein LPJ66_003753 [Kickxella alabastrina]
MPNSGAGQSSRQAAISQPPQTSASASAQVRQIPGFVWDAERGRYFPISSRASDRMERQTEQRETKRVHEIAVSHEIQKQQRCKSVFSVPYAMRQRSTQQLPAGISWAASQSSSKDRIRLSYMLANKHKVDYLNDRSAVTAVSVIDSSHGHRSVAAGHRNGCVAVMQLGAGGSVERIHKHMAGSEITSICRLNAGRYLYTTMGNGDQTGALTIYDSQRARQLYEHQFDDASVFGASCPKIATAVMDSQQLATAVGLTGGVSLLLASSAGTRCSFSVKTRSDILSTAFIDERHVFAGGGRDGRLRLFDCRVSSKKHDPRRGLFSADGCRHDTSIHGVSAQGWLLASASMDCRVHVWDIRMGKSQGGSQKQPKSTFANLINLGGGRGSLASCKLGFSTSQGVVAAASSDNQIRFWSMSSGDLLQAVPLPPAGGSCRALDLDCGFAALPELYISQEDTVSVYVHRTKPI